MINKALGAPHRAVTSYFQVRVSKRVFYFPYFTIPWLPLLLRQSAAKNSILISFHFETKTSGSKWIYILKDYDKIFFHKYSHSNHCLSAILDFLVISKSYFSRTKLQIDVITFIKRFASSLKWNLYFILDKMFFRNILFNDLLIIKSKSIKKWPYQIHKYFILFSDIKKKLNVSV